MTSAPADLRDYVGLRRESTATLMVIAPGRRLIILGSAQPLSTLKSSVDPDSVRRRRGGGGAVLVAPGDLWVDWWIPAGDPRWRADVREAAVAAGDWWAEALAPLVTGTVRVHAGALEGPLEHRVACFAGRGPGEVFVDDRKAVGLTQWRVREGILVSTVLPAHGSGDLVDLLAAPPPGLVAALDHHTTATLGVDPGSLVERLERLGGAWSRRDLPLD